MESTRGTKHPKARAYEVDQASGRVRFGEGVRGERPPSGQGRSAEGRKPTSTDSTCCAPPPFERNHYFLGKLLTADDFQAEQEYHNGKRRLLNRLMYGVGVLCGLHTKQGKGSRLTITAGVAVDGCGREIVVPHDVTLDLAAHRSTRKGAKTACVWLHYTECGVDPVPTMGFADDEAAAQVYNRIRENYRMEVEWGRPKAKTPDDERPPRSPPRRPLKAEEAHGVLLARVHGRAEGGAWVIQTVEEAPRNGVSSHAQLYEALQCLQRQVEDLRRPTVTCPQCGAEFDVSQTR